MQQYILSFPCPRLSSRNANNDTATMTSSMFVLRRLLVTLTMIGTLCGIIAVIIVSSSSSLSLSASSLLSSVSSFSSLWNLWWVGSIRKAAESQAALFCTSLPSSSSSTSSSSTILIRRRQQFQRAKLILDEDVVVVHGSRSSNDSILYYTTLSKNRRKLQENQEDSNKGSVSIYLDLFPTGEEIFRYDDNPLRAPFPRWDFFIEDKDDNEMKRSYQISIMDSMLQFIEKQSEFVSQQKSYSIKTTNPKEYYDSLWCVGFANQIHTSDHMNTPGYWQPEALYVVDGGGQGTIMTSQYTKDIANSDGYAIHFKYGPTERLMKAGFDILMNEKNYESLAQVMTTRWPRLHRLIVVEKGSFPFLAHYSDFVGCNYHNWNEGTESIPLFTVAANVKCNHTFPFPSYSVSKGVKDTSQEWYDHMNKWRDQYGPWHDKTSKVLWRGTLTGRMPEAIEDRGTRWHLTKLVHDETRLTPEQLNLFDVKLTSLAEYSQTTWIDANELGGTSKSYGMPMHDFQSYKAILDVDGHSWSARYAHILCYSSVILKVDPHYVDYFYYPNHVKDDPYTLQPWKHFIPIKHDLSDLVEKASYAVDLNNANHIEEIIRNANDWCANRNLLQPVGMDVLDIWENYIKVLDQSSQLKDLTQSDKPVNGLDGEGRKRILRSLASPENHVSWQYQWNEAKENIYRGVLEMVPI